tara:strand:- start:410 stop:595 length:186 start_codon:yes stop_codon:yes gene_type:complete
LNKIIENGSVNSIKPPATFSSLKKLLKPKNGSDLILKTFKPKYKCKRISIAIIREKNEQVQ